MYLYFSNILLIWSQNFYILHRFSILHCAKVNENFIMISLISLISQYILKSDTIKYGCKLRIVTSRRKRCMMQFCQQRYFYCPGNASTSEFVRQELRAIVGARTQQQQQQQRVPNNLQNNLSGQVPQDDLEAFGLTFEMSSAGTYIRCKNFFIFTLCYGIQIISKLYRNWLNCQEIVIYLPYELYLNKIYSKTHSKIRWNYIFFLMSRWKLCIV